MSRLTQFAKNLSRFQLVTFDVTDTLLRFRTAPAIQYAKTAQKLGVADVDQQRLEQHFRQEFKAMNTKHPNFGRNTGISWQQWWIELVGNVFHAAHHTAIPPQLLDMIAKELLEQYRTRECWTHIEGGRELVQRMRDAVKCVGVISNFDPSLSKVLRAMDLEHKFDFVLTSYETGFAKPHAKIFEIPLERCNVKAQEALHIGNIYEIDYVGARNSGWSSLLVTNARDKLNEAGANTTHVYASLKDMLNALETTDIKW